MNVKAKAFLLSSTLSAFALGVTAPVATAISIIPGNEPAAEAEADLYPGVGQLSFFGNAFCTGSLISDSWFLTARHCEVLPGDLVRFGDDFSLATEQLLGSATVLETFTLGPGELLDGGDVALLQLSNPLAEVIPPLSLLNEPGENILGLESVNVGWGLRADGLGFVASEAPANSAAVRNIIDAYGQAVDDDASLIDGTQNIISTDFDEPGDPSESRTGSPFPIPLEGTTVVGDSGGPALVSTAGGIAIAGVLSGGTTTFSIFGDVSWWTGVFPHFDWINSTISSVTPQQCPIWVTLDGNSSKPCDDITPVSVPEPSTLLSLVAFGIFASSTLAQKRERVNASKR
ncbi:MAG: trypsin-like serine protease [Cyanobacteria bacterium P01_D01_bin.14]